MKKTHLFKHTTIASALLLGLSTIASAAIDQDVQNALDKKADNVTVLKALGQVVELSKTVSERLENGIKANKTTLETKADKTAVLGALEKVVELSKTVSERLENGIKANKTILDTKADRSELDEKANISDINAALTSTHNAISENRLAIQDTETNLNNLVSKVNEVRDEKANISDVNTALTTTNNAINENRAAIQATEDNLNDLAGKVYDNNNIIKNVAFGVGNLNAKVDKKADKAEIDAKLEEKAEQSEVDGLTAAYSDLISTLDKKADTSELDTKANIEDVYNAFTNVGQAFDTVATGILDNQNSINTLTTKVATKADKSELVIVKTTATAALEKVNTNLQAINVNKANIAQNTVAIKHLGDRVNKLDKKIKSGLATQSALNGLFQPYSVGKFNLSAAVGGYQSKTALAIGTGYRFNENVAAKAGIAVGTGKHAGVAYNVGVNYEW